MLYKLTQTNDSISDLIPLEFETLPLEKQLEDLLASRLLTGLFEGNDLMPIFQERSWQAEADIYALNKDGDLVIFELKRAGVDQDAVHQVMRYCETAANWGYERLEEMLVKYSGGKPVDLSSAHREAFNLDQPLTRAAFNNKQRLIIIGSAANANLIRSIDYWKSRGLPIDFIPYRIYVIGGERYLEFFSIPYDTHANPKDMKGVIFDTCKTYIPDSIWYMCNKDRVAAFGDQKHIVHSLNPKDIVFIYHKGEGIVAAGRVKGPVKSDDGQDALYRDLEWLTAKPVQGTQYTTMPAREVSALLEHGFYWARTMKVPYLTLDESEKLLDGLKKKLSQVV